MDKIPSSQAAKLLGISPDKLIVLEKQGLIHSVLTENGKLLYSSNEILKIKARSGQTLVDQAAVINSTIQRETVASISWFSKIFNLFGLTLAIYLILVSGFTVFFLKNPLSASDFFGYFYRYNAIPEPEPKNVLAASTGPLATAYKTSIVADVLKPVASASLVAVKAVDSEKYLNLVTPPDSSDTASVPTVGIPGPEGPVGPQGPQGIVGPTGVSGPVGEAGAVGPNGQTGATGTLPDVGSAGTFGSGTSVPVFTTDAQGRITGVIDTAITGFITTEADTLATVTARGNTTSTNITTTGTGTITSAGLLTASNGLTLTTGALNLTATSGAISLSGLSSSTIGTTGTQTLTSGVTTGTTTSSAFVLNANALTSGTALRLTSTSASGLLFDQNATNTSGTINKLAYGSTTTQTGALTGLNIDLSTNLTSTNQNLTGISLSLAGDTNIDTHTKTGFLMNLGAVTQNTSSSTGTVLGEDIVMGALTLTSGTALNSHGIRVTTGSITQSTGTVTQNGLLVDSTATTITTGGKLNGVKILGPTNIQSVGDYNNIFLGTSTGTVANTLDRATIAVGNIASTDTNNFATLNITNGGSGFLDIEIIRGMINFQGMNTLYDDFTNNTLDTTRWTTTASGGGSSCSIVSAGIGGLLRMTAGTGGAGRACELSTKTVTALTNGYYQRANNPVFETRVSVASLTNDLVYAGFTDTRVTLSSDTNANTNHAYFAKRSTDTNWQCVTGDGTATESYVDTGVTIVAGTFYRLRVEVRNGTTPQTICTVDDGTTTTRVINSTRQPGATSPMDVYLQIDVNANTTAKNMDVDYVRVWQDDPPIESVNSASIQIDSEVDTPTLVATPSPDENNQSSVISDIQSEVQVNPILLITKKIAEEKDLLLDFIVGRITAIRGYFYEIFVSKIHTDELCVKKSDGTETCINGDRLNDLLPTPVPFSTPIPTPMESSIPSATPSPEETSVPTPTEIPTPEETPLPTPQLI